MSEVLLSLSYKEACILKHALRDKVYEGKLFLESPGAILELKEEEFKTVEKEHYEEKRTLRKVKELIDLEARRLNIPKREDRL